MSILIKGMEMPKPGSYLFTVRYDAEGKLCVYPLVSMTGFDDRDMKPETPLFPLIHVPDHGRLIDADACERIDMRPWDAPTIIPADEADNGQN